MTVAPAAVISGITWERLCGYPGWSCTLKLSREELAAVEPDVVGPMTAETDNSVRASSHSPPGSNPTPRGRPRAGLTRLRRVQVMIERLMFNLRAKCRSSCDMRVQLSWAIQSLAA